MCKNIRVIQVFDNFPMGTKFKEILPVTVFGKETKELQRNSTKKNPTLSSGFVCQTQNGF